METSHTSIEKVAIRYGLIIAILLIAFFLIMKAAGLAYIYELRTLNFFILAVGVYKAMLHMKRNNESFSYFTGLGTGFFTSAFALLIFGLFVFIYTNIIDPAFMAHLQANAPFGEYLNPYIASFIIFFEGSISGLILSFGLMQYLRESHITGNSEVV